MIPPPPIYNRIFLSHSTQDMALVIMLRKEFLARHLAFWLAPDEMHNYAGNPYWPPMLKAVTSSRIFLVLLSRNSIGNDNVQKEMREARMEKYRREQNNEEDIHYFLPVFAERLDGSTLSPGNGQEMEFSNDNGYQAHDIHTETGRNNLFEDLIIYLKVPVLKPVHRTAFYHKYFLKVGTTQRTLIFRTLFFFEQLIMNGKSLKPQPNLLKYKKTYEVPLVEAGSEEKAGYQLFLDVRFNKGFAYIENITPRIVHNV